MKPYKFSKTASEQSPKTDRTLFLESIEKGTVLSRDQKDSLAEIFYGVCGSGFAGYKLSGWCWDMSNLLPEYIVEFSYGGFQSYFAGDKTALRKTLGNIKRIIEV
jgi:hypothetical protein